MPCNNIDRDIQENHNTSIGELLSKADVISRKIISAYNCEAKHLSNVTKLSSSIFSAPDLDVCATFLKIRILDDDQNKIYSNKKVVADRIILKIKSYFQTTCRECSSVYNNTFDGNLPLLQYHMCFQGSHDCDEVKNILEATKNLPQTIGSVWL